MAAKSARSYELEVWLDLALLGGPLRVGRLAHDRGQVRFEYEPGWLAHPQRFKLDPSMSLDRGSFFPSARAGNFGVFLDSSPDRWGQMLMDRRERLASADEQRQPRQLYAMDYLLGVQDATRVGALRFCRPGSPVFLDNHKLSAPPVTSLRELEAVAIELTNKRVDDLSKLRQWLAVLVAPGASLGGAHPKANFIDLDGSLWIAKFPSREDNFDRGAWEMLVHDLAGACGIEVPAARLVRLGSQHHTFCVRRFDRVAGERVFFVSALTLLGLDVSEGASYLQLAQFIATQGAPSRIAQDLEQMFRRLLFNIVVSNRDDHLRNHGFIWSGQGWQLAPAFDVNPNVDKDAHVLAVDDVNTSPSIDNALACADFYRISPQRAEQIASQICSEVARNWRGQAQRLGLVSGEIELMAPAFALACAR
jgi:serine/threonine-protein kinase HipA